MSQTSRNGTANDARLATFLGFAESQNRVFTNEEKETLVTKYGVVSFEVLCKKLDELKYGRLRGIKRSHQRTLYESILWYQDYKRMHRREPAMGELTDDTISDFVADEYRVAFPEGESLMHVLSEIWAGDNGFRVKLADAGIRTFDDALKHRQQLLKGVFGLSEGTTLAEEVQKKLAQVADWFDDFCENNKRKPDILKEFDGKSFSAFVKKYHHRYNLNVEEFFVLTLNVIHKDEPPEFLTVFKDPQVHKEVCQQIIEHGVKQVKERMSPKLHDLAPQDLDRFILFFVQKLLNFSCSDTFKEPYVRAGHTQSGKTPMKAIALVVCLSLGIPSLILTKGDRERKELFTKLQDLLKADDKDFVVTKDSLRKNNKNRQAEIKRVFENGGAIVVADTKSQMEKANTCFEDFSDGKKFMAMVDEADAMFRTHDKSQAFETEFEKFMGKRPSLRFYVTATPVPVLLALLEEEGIEDIKFDRAEPCDDYIGVDQMVSEDVFLSQGGLKHNGGISFKGRRIPFTNEEVLNMYLDAVKGKKTLLLDITNPRVYAENNAKVKARLVKKFLKSEHGADIAVVVNVGKGIYLQLPGDPDLIYEGKDKTISEVLGSIRTGISQDEAMDGDQASAREAFDGPIFVFGFALMRRGISYRSEFDVPTHMVAQLGIGHCIENFVQTIGRGTFIGKHVLEKNGHSHVKALMSENDYNMVRSYQRYVEAVEKRAAQGRNIFDAMSGKDLKLPESTNYLQFTKRRTGARSKYKPRSFDSMHNPRFAVSTTLTTEDEVLIKWYALPRNGECYRALLTCWELWRKNEIDFETMDIVDGYNDEYKTDPHVAPITQTAVSHLMKRHIVKDRLIAEKPYVANSTVKRYSLERFQSRTGMLLSKIAELLE
ncbi:MAG: hypothetical protein SGILL_007797, partial [Bacillariaceae sp.]